VDNSEERHLTLKQMRERGWPYSRAHTHRLVQAGKIPAPHKFYPGGRLNAWSEREFEDFLAAHTGT
jgi:predicted DNA-binding transcriptional regulator AlpA